MGPSHPSDESYLSHRSYESYLVTTCMLESLVVLSTVVP
jgi:hypothetical protein